MLRLAFTLSAVLCLLCCSCSRTPAPKLYVPPQGITWRAYEDDIFRLQLPEGWTAEKHATADPELHQVEIHGPHGAFARVSYTHDSKNSTLPKDVVWAMRKADSALAAEPWEGALAGEDSDGYRYLFRIDDVPWEGWILARSEHGSQVSFLAQAPRDAAEARGILAAAMEGLQLKVPEMKTEAPRGENAAK